MTISFITVQRDTYLAQYLPVFDYGQTDHVQNVQSRKVDEEDDELQMRIIYLQDRAAKEWSVGWLSKPGRRHLHYVRNTF